MEEINEWQEIEQHTTLESSEWNRIIINENNNIEVQGGSNPPSSCSSSSTPTHHEEGISSPMTASSSVGGEEGEAPTRAATRLDWANEMNKMLKVRMEAMRVEIVRVASKVRNYAMCAGAFWSITCVAGAVAVTAVLVYVGIQRRRRKVDGSEYLLRQKDEKISQLLLNIAHLNEALSSRRKVQVHRISG